MIGLSNRATGQCNVECNIREHVASFPMESNPINIDNKTTYDLCCLFHMPQMQHPEFVGGFVLGIRDAPARTRQ
jgi:hypothetical protein